MNNEEMLRLILTKIEGLEEGQKALCDEQKALNRRMDTLEEGQKAIRRDIATVNRKLDQLSSDVGQTLAGVTDQVGAELKVLKAK